jgi:hypothetical protein
VKLFRERLPPTVSKSIACFPPLFRLFLSLGSRFERKQFNSCFLYISSNCFILENEQQRRERKFRHDGIWAKARDLAKRVSQAQDLKLQQGSSAYAFARN